MNPECHLHAFAAVLRVIWNQKKKLHLLNEENYVSIGWMHFGGYFYISLNPKDGLKSRWPFQILLLSKAFRAVHRIRASVNSFMLSQLLSDNFCNRICIGTHMYRQNSISLPHKQICCKFYSTKPSSRGVLV
jgi:hypothetical protein